MVTLENKDFIDAVASSGKSKAAIAVYADSSPQTLEKVLNGETDVMVGSLDKLADVVGFDVQIQLVRREAVAV